MGRGLKMEVFFCEKGILGPLCSHPPTHNRSGLVRSHARPSLSRVWAACGYRIARRSPLYSLSKKKLSASSAALAQVFLPSAQLPENNVRLACVKHIASVPSEPGSNSDFDYEKIRVVFYLVESTEWSSLSVTPEQRISSTCWSALSK
jgi:hypothetical protein